MGDHAAAEPGGRTAERRRPGNQPFSANERVREAVHRAIDTDAIRTRIMRGLSTTTALPLAPTTNGYTESLQRPSVYNPERSKSLLAEAVGSEWLCLYPGLPERPLHQR